MKHCLIMLGLTLTLFACGGKKKVDGISLANEVCECRKKGKNLKFDDPEAKKIRMECSKLQGDNWGKIIRDKHEEYAFNKRLNECRNE